MKTMRSLVIALLAIFSVFVSARIKPIAFDMIANVSQLSVATSEFASIGGFDEGGNKGQVAFFFPDQFSSSSVAYKKLDCVTAISIGDSSKFAVKRFSVSRSDETPGFTRVNHDLFFNYGEIAGFFKTACSFIAPESPRASGKIAHASAVIGFRTAKISEYGTQIRPFTSIVGGFETYISPIYSMDKPTTFRAININKSYTPGNQFIIRNPHTSEATTGNLINFESSSPQTSCDVYWDGVLYQKSATTEIIESGGGIRVTLGSPLNSANEIFLFCYDIRGIAVALGFYGDTPKYFPSVIELDYDSYKSYTIASTPSHPISAEFETGLTIHTSSSDFLPKAPKAPKSPISPLE